jgi:predicted membrane protein
MRLFLIIMFFIGIIFAIIGYYMNKSNQKRKTVVQFIDKTLEEQYATQKGAYEASKHLFTDQPILA